MSGQSSTRRELLKRGALTSGAFVLGGVAVDTAAAHGARGGSAFIIDHDYQDVSDGTPFKITGEVTEGNPHWLLETSPSCNGRAPRKEYRGYRFVAEDGDIGNIYVNPDRTISDHGEVWYELAQAHECGGGTTQDSGTDWATTWKVAYKPATP